MVISHLDHILYPIARTRFEEIIGQFVCAGFMEYRKRIRHSEGRQSAFFRLSGGYIEFCSDNADKNPSSIWLRSNDLTEFKRQSLNLYTDLIIVEKAPFGETIPAWLIVTSPLCGNEGTQVSVIQYLRGTGQYLMRLNPKNSIFAIEGVSLLGEDIKKHKDSCMRFLGGLDGGVHCENNRLRIGHQWLEFGERNGICQGKVVDLTKVSCLMHLAAVEKKRASEMLEKAGFLLEEVVGLGLVAQSAVAPSVCLVLGDGLCPVSHYRQLRARVNTALGAT